MTESYRLVVSIVELLMHLPVSAAASTPRLMHLLVGSSRSSKPGLALLEHLGDSDGGGHCHGNNLGDHHLVASRLAGSRINLGLDVLDFDGLIAGGLGKVLELDDSLLSGFRGLSSNDGGGFWKTAAAVGGFGGVGVVGRRWARCGGSNEWRSGKCGVRNWGGCS